MLHSSEWIGMSCKKKTLPENAMSTTIVLRYYRSDDRLQFDTQTLLGLVILFFAFIRLSDGVHGNPTSWQLGAVVTIVTFAFGTPATETA